MAGITQAELARRTGTAQSTISAYERGGHEPSLKTLQHLVAGAGLALRLELREPSTTREIPTTPMGLLIRERRQSIIAAGRCHGASNLRVFGSVARGEDRPDSDVDMLVDLQPSVSLIGLGKLEEELSRILEHDVDVVPASGLKPSVREQIFAEAIPLEPA